MKTERTQAQIRADFDRLVNMTADEMKQHYSSPESDYASLHPPVAAKLNLVSGKTLGKQALLLKGKQQWLDADYALAEKTIGPLEFQMSRKYAATREDGSPTVYAISLMNRGHDPRKAADSTPKLDVAAAVAANVEPAPVATADAAVSESLSTGEMEDRLSRELDHYFRDYLGGEYPDGIGRPWVEFGQNYPFDPKPNFIFRWDNATFSMNYTVTGNTVTLVPETICPKHKEWVADVITPEEVAPTGITVSVTEAEGDAGPKWTGIMIRAGEATNPAENGKKRVYTDTALQEAVEAGLFDDLPGYQRTDAEHTKEEGTVVVGTWGKAVWDKAEKAVKNTFTWLKDKYPSVIHKRVVKAVTEGKTDEIPGFSITGNVYIDKKTPHIVRGFKQIRSCDPISFPSAGGRVIAVTESLNTESTDMIKILDYLKSKGIDVPAKRQTEWASVSVQEGASADFMVAQLKASRPKMFERDAQLETKLTKDEAMLVNLFSEFMAAEGVDPAGGDPTPDPAPDPSTAVTEADKTALALVHRQAYEGVLSGSKLDEVQKKHLRKQFEGKPFDPKYAETAVQEALDMQSEYGKTTPQRVDVTQDGSTKLQLMANDLFCSNITDTAVRESINTTVGAGTISKTPYGTNRSVKQLYIALTGDEKLEMTNAVVRESVDPVMVAQILANAANLRIVQDFALPTEYDFWREIADIVTLNDFKAQTAMRMGHFGSLQKVGRNDAYEELTQGTETNNSYTPETYGGMISMHRKDIINDNTGAFVRMPSVVTMDAKMDLSAFSWALILDNPVLGDGKNLFHTDHANYISDTTANAGFSDAHVFTAESKLRDQIFPGRTNKAALPARFAIIPSALRATAYNVFTAAYGLNNATPTFVQSLQIKAMECIHASAAKDYYVATDKGMCPVLEIGFFQGREIPELLVADNETAGALFTHDKIQWKVRHEYGGSIADHRGIVKVHITD